MTMTRKEREEARKALRPAKTTKTGNVKTLSMSITHAVSLDAGNRSMRRAGRERWNDEDRAAAAAAYKAVDGKVVKPLKDTAAPSKKAEKSKVASAKRNIAPTVEIAAELQAAFDHFNATLFGGTLEAPLLGFARLKKAHGYFWAKQWKRRGAKAHDTHEIALDPYRCSQARDKDVLGTLVHEMVHLQDEQNGTSPKRVYHTKIWAGLMKEVGLYPSTTGAEGGKETGPNCSHYIVKGGRFDGAADALIAKGFKFSWHAAPVVEPEKGKKKKKAGAKAKHTCPDCDVNAWGKPTLNIMCGDCDTKMICADRADYEGEDGDDA